MLTVELLHRVKSKLDLPGKPSLDLAGLNKIYAAYSGHVPNDNIQKRIWLSGDKSRPVTGGEPTQFFENWLEHATGGLVFRLMAPFARYCARSALMRGEYWAR